MCSRSLVSIVSYKVYVVTNHELVLDLNDITDICNHESYLYIRSVRKEVITRRIPPRKDPITVGE